MKNMQIDNFLMLLKIEKKSIKKLLKNFWALILKWNVSILHSKIDILKQMKFLNHLNEAYFPPIDSWRFLKKLFNFWRQKFFWSKLKKIKYYLARKLNLISDKFIDRRNTYFLDRNSYFHSVSLKGYNVFFFKRKIVTSFYKKIYAFKYYIKNFFKTKFLKINSKKFWNLSTYLTLCFAKLFWEKKWFNLLKKFKKKIFSLQIKTDSFFKLFKNEVFVPFQNYMFWVAIIKFDTAGCLIFPSKNISILYKFTLINFFEKKFKNIIVTHKDFSSYSLNNKFLIKNGYNFFNTKRLELIVFPVLYFFWQYRWTFALPIINHYVDFFLIKRKTLPLFIWKFLKYLLKEHSNMRVESLLKVEDVDFLNRLTFLYYKILSEIFFLFFSFSPAKITFLNSKNWKALFRSSIFTLNVKNKNWELLEFYHWEKFNFKIKPFFYFHKSTNKSKYKISFYDFKYFTLYRRNFRKKSKYKNSSKFFTKKISKYFAKTVFSLDFFRSFSFWKFFYMWVYTKLNWFNKKLYFGKKKILYDSYMKLVNIFWPKFFTKKTSFEWILNYGFFYRTGMTSSNLDWNFFSTYKGQLGFWLFKKLNMWIGKWNFNWEKTKTGNFSTLKKNSNFFSFFSFLNRAYLLQYILQFGHTKSNYNTSFWDYLVMIYNEWFILNMLNIQLNLKWNLKIMYKMFFLGGFICLIGAFNILLDGLVGLYGSYSMQPYTWFIWINGLFSNFDWIFTSIKKKISNAYSAKLFFTKKSVRRLIWLWFALWGLLQNLSIDISFFPSLYRSSWVFLESSARFYPTITTSNTECFLPTVYLEYTTVANDYSLLSLTFYINLLIITFWWSWINWMAEFSLFPQKLLSKTYKYKLLPFNFNIKYYKILWQNWIILNFLRWPKYLFFEFPRIELTQVFKYLFIARKNALLVQRKQTFWWFQLLGMKKFKKLNCF